MKTIAFSLFLIALMALILFLWSLWVNAAFGAMITHSHCPNHSRNNSENMHTHDTSDPDHNDKHKAGHPHTWEFDEHCPPGTKRDTSMKSRRTIQDFPSNPIQSDDSTDKTNDILLDESRLLRLPDEDIGGDSRICYATEATLTLWRAAFSVKELDYPTITLQHDTDAGLFDNNPLLKPFRLDVVIKSDVHPMAQDGRCGAVVFFDKAGLTYQNENIVYWADDTDTIDVDFTDTSTDVWRIGLSKTAHCHVDTLGQWTSIEIRHANCVLWTLTPEAPSAPSLHRNKTTTWASLKMQ